MPLVVEVTTGETGEAQVIRVARTIAFGLFVLLFSVVGNASAAMVSNPGPIQIDFETGFIKIGDVPERSIDGLQPNAEISGSVSADGAIHASSVDVEFDPIQVPISTPVGEVIYGVQFSAVAAVNGQIDPLAGSFELELPIRAKISKESGSNAADVGSNCFIGSAETPIMLSFDSEAAANLSLSANSQGGVLYDFNSGLSRLGATNFTVPGQNGCTGTAGGLLNENFGLPAEVGQSLVEFGTSIEPVLTSPAGIALAGGPVGETDSTKASFFVRSNLGAGISFECRLDGSLWENCSSGIVNYVGLALGPHTLDVRALQAGEPTGHEASRSWTVVETTSEVLARLVVSPNPVGAGRELTLDARQSDVPNGVKLCSDTAAGETGCGYQWDLNGDGSTDRVTNDPLIKVSQSTPGIYTATVTVFDIASASDSEAVEYTVEALPHAAITSGPPSVTTSRFATFTFSITGGAPGSTAECSLDGAEFSVCQSDVRFSLDQGPGQTLTHNFRVRGVSPGGVVGDVTTYVWEVRTPFVVKGNLAVFDGSRLTAEIKCARKFSPRCLSLNVKAVTSKTKKAKAISTPAKTSLRAGKSTRITMKIKPRFRQRVRTIASSGRRSLPIRAEVKFRHKGRLKTRQIVFTYRVALD